MQKRMLQLKTERLLLKPYEECDREAMLSLLEEKPDIQQEIDDSKLKSAN